jgi:hypothetical protein
MAYVKVGITEEDCIALATRLREEDIKEILAVSPHRSLVDSLLASADVSCKAYTVMEDDIGCIAIFGIRDYNKDGIPWLLTSDLLFDKSCRKFIRHCKGYVKELTDNFRFSYNYVSVTNSKAHRWLTWMGFSIHKAHTRTLNGVVFHPFTYVRKL